MRTARLDRLGLAGSYVLVATSLLVSGQANGVGRVLLLLTSIAVVLSINETCRRIAGRMPSTALHDD